MDERIKALAKQGNAHLDQQQLPEAIAVYTELLQLCEEQQRIHPDDNEVKRFWCLACNEMGTVHSMSGELIAAREWYSKAVPVCERLAEEPGAVQAGRDLSRIYGNLGDAYATEGDLASARSWYEKKWETARRLSEQTEETEDQYGMAIACCKMGFVSRGEEQLGWYRAALEVLIPLVAQFPDNRLYIWMKEGCEKTIRVLENAE